MRTCASAAACRNKGQSILAKSDIVRLLSISFCHVISCHGRQLRFDRTGNSNIRSTNAESHTLEPNMKCIGWSVAEIWPFEIFQEGGRLPSWIWTNRNWGYSIRRPWNRSNEPNMKWIRSPVSEIWPFEIRHITRGPPFWGRENRRGLSIIPFERAMVVSYSLSIVTIARSLNIRQQLAIECLRRSN